MPRIPDLIQILSDARARVPDDRDARLMVQRIPSLRRRLRRAIGAWRRGPDRAPEDGIALPVLRDYPWRASDRS